jgi:hypothetical protein
MAWVIFRENFPETWEGGKSQSVTLDPVSVGVAIRNGEHVKEGSAVVGTTKL